MNEFDLVKMTDVADVTSAKRIFARDYVDAGVPFYRGKEITELHRGALEVSTDLYITEEKFSEIKNKHGVPEQGDILLTSVGTLGSVYLVKPVDRFYFKDGNVTWFRKLEGVAGAYLRYWLISPDGRAQLQKCMIGSSQSAYTIENLKRMEIRLPPIETQYRIASILGAYDDLIEVNRRRIALLEEMARGLFEEWFVRFRFPGHETVPILDTPSGPLPEGWKQIAFASLLERTIGGLWGEASETTKDDQRVSVIRGTDFPKLLAGNYAGVSDRFVSNRELASRALIAGDLVLEASGGSKDQPVGRALYVTASLIEKLRPPVAPASFCRLLRPTDQVGSGAYLYGLLQAMYQDGRIEKFQKQSTGLRNLSMKQLAAETVTAPDTTVLASFGKTTIPLLEAASLHRHECKALSKSRDLLLPRLISGQLSVDDAGRELEEAA